MNEFLDLNKTLPQESLKFMIELIHPSSAMSICVYYGKDGQENIAMMLYS